MSDCPQAASPTAVMNASADARPARLAKFERERLIVDYLNRGVSVAEIAAHIGVGEKRMRAIIREILARRQPHPPEEFVAIQVNRLNEALLVAFSAMSGTNLKAVDRVIRIVRELDRYHGFVAAERRLPDPRTADRRPGAAAEGAAAFACDASLSSEELEGIDFIPGLATALEAADPAARPEAPTSVSPERRSHALDRRLEQRSAATTLSKPCPEETAKLASRRAAPSAPEKSAPTNGPAPGRDARPQNPSQRIEELEFAPGIPDARETPAGVDGAQEPRASAGPGPQPDRSAPLDGRPEKPPQDFEKVEFAPRNGWAPQSAPASGEAVRVAIPSPAAARFGRVRMTPNGVAAS